VIDLPTIISGYSELYCRSGAERTENRVERSGERELQKNYGAERGGGGRGAKREREAGVAEIGWSAKQLFRRSRSAHMLCFMQPL